MIALRSPSQNRVFRNQNLCVPCQLLHVLGLRPTQPGDLAEWSFSLQDHPAPSVATDKLGWWRSNICCLYSMWHFLTAAEDQTCAMLSFRRAMLPERTGRPGLSTPFMSGMKPLDMAMDGEEGWINPFGGLLWSACTMCGCVKPLLWPWPGLFSRPACQWESQVKLRAV